MNKKVLNAIYHFAKKINNKVEYVDVDYFEDDMNDYCVKFVNPINICNRHNALLMSALTKYCAKNGICFWSN